MLSPAATVAEPKIALLRQRTESLRAMPTKQARSERTRDRLLEAGQELLQTGGFDDVSIAQIARHAGCSVGAFYVRFRDKEAYFQFLLDGVIENIKLTVLDVLAPDKLAKQAGPDVVRYCVAHCIALNRQHEGLIRAVQKHTAHHSESWQPVKALGHWIVSYYTDAVAASHGQSSDVLFKSNTRVGFQIISGHLMNAIMNKPDQLGLHSELLQFWMSEVVLHCLAVKHPKNLTVTPSAVKRTTSKKLETTP